MSEQQDGSSEKPGGPSENASSAAKSSDASSASASKAKSSEASASKEGASASKSKDASSSASKVGGGGSASKERSASKSKEGSKASASKSKDGSTSKESNASKSGTKSKDGSKSKDDSKASASKSKEGSELTSNSQASASKSKASKSAEGSKQHSKSAEGSRSKTKSASQSKEASAESKKSKSSQSKQKSKSKEHSKSKDKPKSGEKPKSKEKPKSAERDKSKKTAKSKSATSKSSKKSKDVKLQSKKKVNLGGAKIGFVGAGKMTDAIVRGLLNVAKLDAKKMFVAGKSGKTLDAFKGRGLTVTKRAYDIFGQFDCDIVFLCVHGHVIRSCFKAGGLRPLAFTVNYIPNQKHPLYLLSLIGGVNLADVRATLLDPENPDKYMLFMHRVMLNIGVGYGIGMGALDVEPDGNKCSPVVRELLLSITKLDHFPEQMMDAACAIGGSGLAICYYFIANLADGAFRMGLNKVMATKLAAKALQSAAQCLLESDKHPSELQDSVTSQGGSAIYGIHVLDKADCSSGFQSAIEAAYRRLKELVDIEPVAEVEAKPKPFK